MYQLYCPCYCPFLECTQLVDCLTVLACGAHALPHLAQHMRVQYQYLDIAIQPKKGQ